MQLNDLQKLWDCAYKPIWVGRLYLGDPKYINIVFLQWLEVLMPCKIPENMYKHIYNAIDMLKLDCFTYGVDFLLHLG